MERRRLKRMYEEMTFEKIMDEMMEDMPNGLDTSEGSLIYNACAKQAARLEQAYIDLGAVADNQYPDTADLDHLVKFGQERGIYIDEATPAEFEGVFNVAVPIGTEFSGDDYNYIVTELINDEEHKYRLECEDAGSEQNGWTGDLMCLDDVDGLEDATLTKLLVEGTDEEDEETYRMRLLDSFEIKPYAGNRKYYEQEIGAIDGVGGVKAYRRIGSTIDIAIISDEYGAPSQELVSSVQEKVDPISSPGDGNGIAPIGHAITIKAVESQTINVSAAITCDEGYTTEGLTTQINNAVEAYLLELRKKWTTTDSIVVRRASVENAIYNIEGVVDVSNVVLENADQNGNITLQKDIVPIKGVITCT